MPDTISLTQGTDEWLRARAGKVTASRVADVIAKGRGNNPSASRRNYLAELAAERLTGEPAEHYSNTAMQWGTDMEPQARAAYSFIKDVEVIEVGLVDHPVINMTAASPDGLVGLDGMVEFKCPNTATHIDTLLKKTVPGKYITQMQWQMACAERQWCDFVSFDPRMPEDMTLFVQRVERDDKMIGELEIAVVAFLKEVEDTIEALKQ